jgi:hypothetical protein
VSAQGEYEYDAAFGEQTGALPTFPYRTCATGPGAYQLAPAVRSVGGGKYCFTIQVAQGGGCAGACCNTDLHKIEVREPHCPGGREGRREGGRGSGVLYT